MWGLSELRWQQLVCLGPVSAAPCPWGRVVLLAPQLLGAATVTIPSWGSRARPGAAWKSGRDSEACLPLSRPGLACICWRFLWPCVRKQPDLHCGWGDGVRALLCVSQQRGAERRTPPLPLVLRTPCADQTWPINHTSSSKGPQLATAPRARSGSGGGERSQECVYPECD